MFVSAKIDLEAHTQNEPVEKAEIDSGDRPGIMTGTAEMRMALGREMRELKQNNEILRKAWPLLPRRCTTTYPKANQRGNR